MRGFRLGVIVAAVAGWVLGTYQPRVDATHHDVFFTEILAGANGDSRVQFIEIVQDSAGQNCWGPQVPFPATTGSDDTDDDCYTGVTETRSRTMLVFFDAQDREIGRFKFPENPPTAASGPSTVLIATQEFAALAGAPVPDLIMPALLSPVNGKVCFRDNPENGAGVAVNLCVSYGAFAGDTQGAGPPTTALPTVNAQSLRRPLATDDNLNAQFALGVPSPTNFLGATFTFPVIAQVAQGANLFNLETFMGNGRTCASCHLPALNLGMNPANITTRFAGVSNTFDPLFLAETAATGFDFNLNTLVVTARPTHQSGTDFLNTSGGDLQGIVTSGGSARGKVLRRVNATTYRIYGGLSPVLTGVVTDAFGNQATVTSVTGGDLHALEDPARMRTSTSQFGPPEVFPQGRGLILENIDGFANPPVFRKAPPLLNLSRTAPFGLSGEFPDLASITNTAVLQHFPRTLARSHAITAGSNPDFRLPTADELAALEAFMLAQEFPAGSSPDRFSVDHFITNVVQEMGRILFISRAKCAQCHGGPVLATTTVDILGKGVGVNAAFNTGVTKMQINEVGFDNLPCEPGVGACHSREFSVPQLLNVGNLGPFFHDASAGSLRSVLGFYNSLTFRNSPAGQAIGGISLSMFDMDDLLAFLSALGAVPTPTVSAIPNTTINQDSTSSALPFQVGPVSATLSGVSSNTALIPDGNIVFNQPPGTRVARRVTVTPAPNQTGLATITVTATDLGGTASRSFAVTVVPAPTMAPLADVTIAEDSTPAPIAVTVGANHVPVGSLTVTAATTNAVLHSLTLGGADANRTLTIVPTANRFGTATITVTASDGTRTAQRSFTLTVTPVNDPPEIGAVANQQIATAAPIGPLAVTLFDPDNTTLTLTATSSNLSIVPNANITLGGSGNDRTITLGIPPGASGTTVITLTATDGALTTSRLFTVTVTAPPPPSAPPPEPPSPGPPGPPSPPPTVQPPGAPSGLTAAVRGGTIDLTWVAAPASDEPPADVPADADAPAADPATGYRIEVGRTPGASDAATFTTGVTTTFSVTGLLPGTYYVRVRAFNSAGNGPPSNELIVTLATPGGPRNLRASLSGRTLQLAWDAPDSGGAVTGYQVEVGSAAGQSNIGVVPVAGLAVTLESVPDGTYFIRVTALRATGASGPSNEVVVSVGAVPPPPCTAVPGVPILSGSASGTIVVLSWTPAASGGAATSYVLQAGSAPGSSNIATLSVASAVTSFSSPAPNGTYYLRVVAVNACGSSLASNEVTVTIGAPPPPPAAAPGAPSSLTSQVVGSQVTLSWAPPTTGGAPTRYIIEVTDLGGNPIVSVDTGNPATSFTHTGAPSGVYTVRVRGANAGGVGPPSATVTVTIP